MRTLTISVLKEFAAVYLSFQTLKFVGHDLLLQRAEFPTMSVLVFIAATGLAVMDKGTLINWKEATLLTASFAAINFATFLVVMGTFAPTRLTLWAMLYESIGQAVVALLIIFTFMKIAYLIPQDGRHGRR